MGLSVDGVNNNSQTQSTSTTTSEPDSVSLFLDAKVSGKKPTQSSKQSNTVDDDYKKILEKKEAAKKEAAQKEAEQKKAEQKEIAHKKEVERKKQENSPAKQETNKPATSHKNVANSVQHSAVRKAAAEATNRKNTTQPETKTAEKKAPQTTASTLNQTVKSQKAKDEISTSDLTAKGSFSSPTSTFEIKSDAFGILNIKEGDASSVPLRTTNNGVKILSTDPNVKPDDITILGDEKGSRQRVILPNGQEILINGSQSENSSIIFNGDTIAMCNITGSTFKGSTVYNSKTGSDKVYAMNCHSCNFETRDKEIGVHQNQSAENFVLNNCVGAKVKSTGDDKILAINNSTVELQQNASWEWDKDKTKVAADSSSKVKELATDLTGTRYSAYKLNAPTDEVASEINNEATAGLQKRDAKIQDLRSEYNFEFGKKQSVSNSETHTQGEFSTNVKGFEGLNIAQDTPQSKPLAVVSGVKILSPNADVKAEDIKVQKDDYGICTVTLPRGQRICLGSGKQSENSEIVFDPKTNTVAMCGINGAHFKGSSQGDKVAVINCNGGTFDTADRASNTKETNHVMFVNSKMMVSSCGGDNVVATGKSTVLLKETPTSHPAWMYPTLTSPPKTTVSADPSSTTTTVDSGSGLFQKNFDPKWGVEEIIKNNKKYSVDVDYTK